MTELLITSGKGGTGKTSLAASFALLADRPVVADCDVDAADLHLVLSPQVGERHDYHGGHVAVIRREECTRCGVCADRCRFDAVRQVAGHGDPRYEIDAAACEGCGVCVRLCPRQAIDFPERRSGEWMVSTTRCGPMVHARLTPAAGNSGKLVSLVRERARAIAEEQGRALVIIDGPPGTGCPVIASMTGVSFALIVTEPTVSGEHDLARIVSLARHFRVPAAICVNRWDLNPTIADRIENAARAAGIAVAGRVRYDAAVTSAQLAARAVVETDAASAPDVRDVWADITSLEEFKV